LAEVEGAQALLGNAEIAEVLLAAGAKVDPDEPSLGTPLKAAALKGNEEVAETSTISDHPRFLARRR